MGVRGLTTFIKSQEKKYLKTYKLHNCKVLLDGNSVASNLFIWSNIESAFGGDYDKFAKYIKEFFKVLQKCEISPLVVFDGGYEQRKLQTVYSRMRDKFRSARNAQPLTGSINFPLFMRIVFREVLLELVIPFAQSDFEADDELAALARQLQCPVLSYDSDFYIYDVLYIPLPTLGLEPIQLQNIRGGENIKPEYYLDCKIYSVDVLIESFGGLDKTMLPLLAALLGNDYIKRSLFKAFYTNLKIPKGKTTPLQRRIKAVIEWLRKESFDSAVKKILARMKKKTRRHVMRQLRKVVNGYVQCTSILSDYLAISDETNSIDCNINSCGKDLSIIDSNIINMIEQIDEYIDTIEDDIESADVLSMDNNEDALVTCGEVDLSESCSTQSEDEFIEKEEDSEMPLEIPEHFHNEIEDISSEVSRDIPNWLLDCARKGKIQSCVIDILKLNQYFFPPQVEDHSLSPSNFISLKVLSATVGLLIGKCDCLVKYWTRNGSRLVWYTVEPIYETPSLKFPACEEVLGISESVRRTALLEVAEISIDLTVIPEDWHLFVVAIIFWLKNMKEPAATEAHLHTIVMCLVAIYTVDAQIGVYRNKQFFMRKYKKYLNKVTECRSKEKKALKESFKLNRNLEVDRADETVDPKREFANISNEDCVLIFDTILPYHHLSEQVKTKPKLFCLSTVHAFAQFQSCLFHLGVLNSVLGFPLKEIMVSHLYSGTFIYNMYLNLSKRSNINAYVETVFQSSPSLLKLYKSLINLLETSLTEVNLYKKKVKLQKKKKKQNKQNKVTETLTSEGDYEDSDIFIDENNMFSGLSLSA